MRAVWSFWSTPFATARARRGGPSATTCWRGSCRSSSPGVTTRRRRWSPTRRAPGLLVDGLGLEFDTVSLALDRLDVADPSWWTTGKLVAISEQDEPFVHLDPDVFMWDRLPPSLTAAPVFTQNPEPYTPGGTYYRPELIESALAVGHGTWLPPEWSWYRRAGVVPRGECCGIVGGQDLAFLHHYAEQGLRLIDEPANAARARAARPQDLSITLEQYLLAACIEHHRGRPGRRSVTCGSSTSSARGPKPVTASPPSDVGSPTSSPTPSASPTSSDASSDDVRRDYPERYERCRLTKDLTLADRYAVAV